MILREATIKYKGYDPDLIRPKSTKRVCVSCENPECKNPIRYVMKYAYHPLCGSCARSGKNNNQYGKIGTNSGKKFTKEHRQKISESNRGNVKSRETKRKHSEFMSSRTGELGANWKGGISFEPYCEKFNDQLKQTVRNRHDNCDYVSGLHTSICNDNRNLDVHHVNYDKNCGCDGNKCKLIPLSRVNHIRTNSNRPFWQRLFIYALEIDKWYYQNSKICVMEMI